MNHNENAPRLREQTEGQNLTGVSGTASVPGGTTTTQQRPAGGWPIDREQSDETLARLRWERARREAALGVIRAHLEEQPSPRAVREAARRWCTDITQLGEQVAREVA